MKRMIVGAVALTMLGLCALSDATQPPGGDDKDKGPKGGKKGPPFELGKVLPFFIREELELTPEQETKLDALEKDVKKKLEKILTADQIRQLQQMKKGPPPKKDDFDDKDDKKDDKKGKKKKKDDFKDKNKDAFEQVRTVPATLQSYAAWTRRDWVEPALLPTRQDG